MWMAVDVIHNFFRWLKRPLFTVIVSYYSTDIRYL
jgi:hypothetical protein